MRPTWLIEAGVYGDEVAPLVAEVRRQGMAAEVVPYRALEAGAGPVVAGGRPLTADDAVVGYGTYPFAQQILRHHPWKPGAWCSAANLDCGAYFAHFGRHLLNRNYALLPGAEAVRQRDRLFDVFGVGDRVFVRPASCHKLFVGRCVDRESFATALAPARYDPATLVVVAAPKPIGREWRLVVADDRVVAGSRYADGGRPQVAADCPAEVTAFAEAVLADVAWRPDPAFMLDVCESAGRLWLVELNSFSGSWLYRCDPAAVVATVGELAERCRRQSGP